MKQEERNSRTRGALLGAAMHEFASHGYEAASMNVICAESGVSKGNLYHYYSSKEELYLACLSDGFQELTAFLEKSLSQMEGNQDDQRPQTNYSLPDTSPQSGISLPDSSVPSVRSLRNSSVQAASSFHDPSAQSDSLLDRYFDARMEFFRTRPDLELLLGRAMMTPEPELRERIHAVRTEFDRLNRKVIDHILQQEEIRDDLSPEEVYRLFDLLQNMWNTTSFELTDSDSSAGSDEKTDTPKEASAQEKDFARKENQPQKTEASVNKNTPDSRETACRLLTDVFFYGVLARKDGRDRK